MALPCGIHKLENEKFVECPEDSGQVAVRVKVCDQDPVEVEFPDPDYINTFDSVSSVASGSLVDVVTYTVPAGKLFKLSVIEASGCNVSEYTVDIDGNTEGFKRSYWSNFNVDFNFIGLKLSAGSIIKLKAEHNRPSTGDFEGKILGILEDI